MGWVMWTNAGRSACVDKRRPERVRVGGALDDLLGLHARAHAAASPLAEGARAFFVLAALLALEIEVDCLLLWVGLLLGLLGRGLTELGD